MSTRQMNKRVASGMSVSATKRVRMRLLSGCLIAWLALGIGCDAKPKSQAEPAAQSDAAPLKSEAEATADPAVIAQAGPVNVTFDDFEYALRLNRLVMPLDNLEAP